MQKIIYTKENIAKSINQKQKSHTGVPTAMLELLQCPICGGELYLQNTELNQRYVFHSDLNCDCGYHAQIQDGILLTSNKNQSKYDRPDLTREYYKDIPADLTSLFQKSYNWMQDQMQIDNWNNKVILETHINAYFYLQVALDRLDKNAKYIIIDKYPEMLKLYKGLIDSTDSNFNILYIADASLDFPIRKNSVDLFIDYFSSNEYQFSNHHWLVHLITPYMKKDGLTLGTYFYFHKGKKSIQNLLNYYPEAYEQNFNLPLFLNALQQDWSILNQTNIGFTTQTGTNWAFNYHVDGEEMHLFSYLARLKLK